LPVLLRWLYLYLSMLAGKNNLSLWINLRNIFIQKPHTTIMKKILLNLGLLAVLILAACTAAQQPATNSEIKHDAKPDTGQNAAVKPQDGISPDVIDLLAKSKTKVKSIYYKYRGPETGSNFFGFYVKGSKIKYLPWKEFKSLDQPADYDSVFIDKSAQTAQSYCEALYCAVRGKKADLKYNDSYIYTIYDWIGSITQAKKVGEEVIDDRSTWKIETNQGTFWIDTFYGIPLKIESGGKTYKFEQIAVNSVQDSDVVPYS